MLSPRIITARELGLHFQNRFGTLGAEHFLTLHHTAGPKDDSLEEAIRLDRQYHRDHASKGWGGIGYHFNLVRHLVNGRGVIICLRPTSLKGAHVGGHNSRNVGVMCHGTTGDRPTQTQVDLFRWLLINADSRKMPAAHRTDRPLNRPYTQRRGHNDWDGHRSNACPGTHKPLLKLERS